MDVGAELLAAHAHLKELIVGLVDAGRLEPADAVEILRGTNGLLTAAGALVEVFAERMVEARHEATEALVRAAAAERRAASARMIWARSVGSGVGPC